MFNCGQPNVKLQWVTIKKKNLRTEYNMCVLYIVVNHLFDYDNQNIHFMRFNTDIIKLYNPKTPGVTIPY